MVTRRARRWMTWGASTLVVLLVVAVAVVTWIQSGTLAAQHLQTGVATRDGSTVVTSVEPGSITLDRNDRTDRPGTWGLVFDGGRAVVGPVIEATPNHVVRSLDTTSGALLPGTRVSFDRTVWDLDQARDLGFGSGFAAGSTGALTVWTLSGSDDTWVVVLHDRLADPAEAFRAALVASAAGYPVVVGSYRSDPSQAGAGNHGYGYDEWEDAASVVDFALARGAGDIVVIGLGSGASVAGVYLREAQNADRVIGVVVDSPVLDLGSIVAAEWRESGIPGWLIGWTQAMAAVRFGVDFGAVDHLERPWTVPTLILHGRDDRRHPLVASEDLAVMRPESVRLITFPSAGTGESWNTDPDRYAEVLTGFLDRVASGPSRLTTSP